MVGPFSKVIAKNHPQRRIMGTTILLIILVAVFLAVLPAWPYSRAWGLFPAGLVSVIILMLLLLIFFDKA